MIELNLQCLSCIKFDAVSGINRVARWVENVVPAFATLLLNCRVAIVTSV